MLSSCLLSLVFVWVCTTGAFQSQRHWLSTRVPPASTKKTLLTLDSFVVLKSSSQQDYDAAFNSHSSQYEETNDDVANNDNEFAELEELDEMMGALDKIQLDSFETLNKESDETFEIFERARSSIGRLQQLQQELQALGQEQSSSPSSSLFSATDAAAHDSLPTTSSADNSHKKNNGKQGLVIQQQHQASKFNGIMNKQQQHQQFSYVWSWHQQRQSLINPVPEEVPTTTADQKPGRRKYLINQQHEYSWHHDCRNKH